MNKLPNIFVGIFVIFGSAWLGLVNYPLKNLGNLQPVPDEATGGVLPPTVSGLAVAGHKVYAANGCVPSPAITSAKKPPYPAPSA